METIYFFTVLWFMSAVALGVGSSSLAIVSFLVALKDKNIDPSERRMLGVIYWTLRWAMLSIGALLLVFTFLFPTEISSLWYVWAMLGVLICNAILMTKHWISFRLGPALQAATWYTVGFIMSIELFSLISLTPTAFLTLYVVDIMIAVALVNGLLKFTK